MGTRSLLLYSVLIGFTSTAMAQTASLDDSSYTLTATVTQAPSNTDIPIVVIPVTAGEAAATEAAAVTTAADSSVVDGGDGISDAPNAGWVSEPRRNRID